MNRPKYPVKEKMSQSRATKCIQLCVRHNQLGLGATLLAG